MAAGTRAASVAGSGAATAAELARRVLRGDRRALSRAITLVESSRRDHQAQAQDVMQRVLAARSSSASSSSFRMGVSGTPGVGKSTFIESFGRFLTTRTPARAWPDPQRRVAVLTVDPSSAISGGSLLGDLTRMTELSRDPLAYVRQSPTRGVLGGVARHTDEVVSLCEAAGYGVVIVESVGVGQSEAAIANVVDFLTLLVAPGGGDELQGSKKGVLEFADLLLVNKADSEHVRGARRTASEFRDSMMFSRGRYGNRWRAPVSMVSSIVEAAGAAADADAYYTGASAPRCSSIFDAPPEWLAKRVADAVAASERPLSMGELWSEAMRFRGAAGELARQRRVDHRMHWMWLEAAEEAMRRLRQNACAARAASSVESELRAGTLTPRAAAMRVVDAVL